MPISRFYKLYLSPNRKYVKVLKNLLGFVPGNLSLYRLAFRHKSVAQNIKKGVKNSNERLEFLGDAVLGSVVAEVLFKLYPYEDEGFLTELRSKIVSRNNLNQLARKLGFDKLVEFDPKILSNGRQGSGSLLGDAFEALVGAVYLDKGYDFTRHFLVNHIIKAHIDIHTLEQTETNFKSKLIEWCQRHGKDITFELTTNMEGESAKLFTIQVNIDGEILGSGKEFSKKNAEKLAAEKACAALGI
ncbi:MULTISPECIES: ribonuclease III [unclassified Mucilaginibacter]|uniref:ribonuclease III n=1 Tax=unclassified Mucilaginibacter TaxID=2617802 RepID=UPI00095D33B6|nr:MULTISPECIES: ribonuclease III [unclassified Mucilaginibacter]OJW16460.1 MAG: ribonuclease III [Mucilaginibacter sp. 44-25]PLW88253.1 MAG: ribonuclease III [Mucilaginibacter sp.]HEK19068.1 ribonuclease III [Bacteroidota bacterium]